MEESAGTGSACLPVGRDSPVRVDFVGLQLRRIDDAQIGRDDVAAFQEHDVAWHEIGGGDDRGLSASSHGGLGGAHLAKGLHRARGFQLGDEAEQRIDDQDGENGAGLDPFTESERSDHGGGEQRHEETPELRQENQPRASLFDLTEDVGAVTGQPARCFVTGESRRSIGAESLEHLAWCLCPRFGGEQFFSAH